jgi:RNA polymerase sigma-70 factor (ECF subfamily)
VAVAVRDTDLAKEAVDEAMARAFQRWRSVTKMSNPEGWVYRVAMNWATSRLRRRAVPVRGLETPAVTYQPEPGLVAAVRSLPRQQRDVVIARCLLDMSEVDTAEALGVSVGTVKSLIVRVRDGTAHVFARSCDFLESVDLPPGWPTTCLE